MAETVEDVLVQVKENLTENAINGTTKTPATPEGMAVAYGSLVIMALIPIFVGSLRSVNHHKEQKALGNNEKVSRKEAAMFPVIASGALLGLYLLFQFFSKEYVNLLLTGYFFVLGVFSLCHLMSPVISSLVPSSIPNNTYTLQFKEKSSGDDQNDESESENYLIDYSFKSHDIFCLICSLGIGAWYLLKKHWIANNMFGMAFAVHGIEVLFLNNVVNGCILLGGLFFYDIFWVFGTDVMVTVAHSFEAPIKLVFPQDLLEKGFAASNFSMLGLGDIVIPGIFIALLLRFDVSLKRKSRIYFFSTFIAYFIGLMTTIAIMYVFKHAQPALLYLVPACIFPALTLALCKGDIQALLQYEDYPTAPEGKAETTEKSCKEKKAK